jgi:hypothetical protein
VKERERNVETWKGRREAKGYREGQREKEGERRGREEEEGRGRGLGGRQPVTAWS